jgi:hypothetical protein
MYNTGGNLANQAAGIRSQDYANMGNIGNLASNLANTGSGLANNDVNRMNALLTGSYQPTQQMYNYAALGGTIGGQYNTAKQNQAQLYSDLGQQGVNSMLGGVLNSNDLLASGQANQLGMLNSLIGSTPQYNSQGQVTGYNNNAANTVGGLFNLGSSVYNGVKSLF